MKKPHFILVAGCLVIGRALFANAPQTTNTAAAVLKQYVETMDHQNTCIFNFSGKSESDAKYSPSLNAGKGGHKITFESGEFDCDGDRFKFRMNQWGQRTDRITPQSSPYYTSVLWDGNVEYVFFKDPFYQQSPGRLTVRYANQLTESSRAKVLGVMFPGRFLVGYLTSSHLRADELLQKSEKVNLRKDREVIQGAECNVVDVAGRWGRGTIWFSSRHGGLIAKAEFHQREGDLYSDRPLKAGAVVDFLIHNISFAQVADVWFTTGGTQEKKQIFAAGGFENYTREFKLTDITLNPDVARLNNYFTLADVAEGSSVGIWKNEGEFVWQNARIVGPLPPTGKTEPLQ